MWKYLEPRMLVWIVFECNLITKKPTQTKKSNQNKTKNSDDLFEARGRKKGPTFHTQKILTTLPFTYIFTIWPLLTSLPLRPSVKFLLPLTWKNEPNKASKSSLVECKSDFLIPASKLQWCPDQSEQMPGSFQPAERRHLLVWLHPLLDLPAVSVPATSASWFFLRCFSLLPPQGCFTLLVLLPETLFSQILAIGRTLIKFRARSSLLHLLLNCYILIC